MINVYAYYYMYVYVYRCLVPEKLGRSDRNVKTRSLFPVHRPLRTAQNPERRAEEAADPRNQEVGEWGSVSYAQLTHYVFIFHSNYPPTRSFSKDMEGAFSETQTGGKKLSAAKRQVRESEEYREMMRYVDTEVRKEVLNEEGMTSACMSVFGRYLDCTCAAYTHGNNQHTFTYMCTGASRSSNNPKKKKTKQLLLQHFRKAHKENRNSRALGRMCECVYVTLLAVSHNHAHYTHTHVLQSSWAFVRSSTSCW
jgi:hypothetical protein